jgi:hypothetical protein
LNTISATTMSQRAANAAAFAQTASAMFAMDAMLTRRPDHLKMPRPDAYNCAGGVITLSTDGSIRCDEISGKIITMLRIECAGNIALRLAASKVKYVACLQRPKYGRFFRTRLGHGH